MIHLRVNTFLKELCTFQTWIYADLGLVLKTFEKINSKTIIITLLRFLREK